MEPPKHTEPPEPPAAASPAEEQKRLALSEKLNALGYVDEDPGIKGPTGVVKHDRTRAYQGLNLLFARGAVLAVLTDMAGRELHRWSLTEDDLRRLVPGYARGNKDHPYISRAHVFENGDLIAIVEKDPGILRMDKDSRVRWLYESSAHHDFDIAPDGTILVLCNSNRQNTPYDPTREVADSVIHVLDEDGRFLREVSLLRSLERSRYAPLIHNYREEGEPPFIDLLHANAVELLDGSLEQRSRAFRKGNVLVSLRNLDLVGVVDLETETMAWALTGMWHRQHDPTVVAGGHILVFDNMGPSTGSRVIEFDPSTHEIRWEFASSSAFPFYTRRRGTAARLPDGNTLITESAAGRAFEVTREGEVVWEYVNPMGTSLEEVVRLPPDLPVPWANGTPAPGSPFTGK